MAATNILNTDTVYGLAAKLVKFCGDAEQMALATPLTQVQLNALNYLAVSASQVEHYANMLMLRGKI
jgi:hypothetical protein